jgi:hypothetical protein
VCDNAVFLLYVWFWKLRPPRALRWLLSGVCATNFFRLTAAKDATKHFSIPKRFYEIRSVCDGQAVLTWQEKHLTGTSPACLPLFVTKFLLNTIRPGLIMYSSRMAERKHDFFYGIPDKCVHAFAQRVRIKLSAWLCFVEISPQPRICRTGLFVAYGILQHTTSPVSEGLSIKPHLPPASLRCKFIISLIHSGLIDPEKTTHSFMNMLTGLFYTASLPGHRRISKDSTTT